MSKSGLAFTILMVVLALLVAFVIGAAVGASADGTLGLAADSFTAWISALSTLAIAGLTTFLARESWSLRKLQIEQINSIRREAIRPSVNVYVRSSRVGLNFIDVHVNNTGKGSARSVRFNLVNKNPQAEDVFALVSEKLTRLAIISEGIGNLAPNEERKSFLLSFTEITKNFGERVFDCNIEVSINFFDAEGNAHESVSHINFSEFFGIRELGGDPLNKAVKALEKLADDIHRVATGFRRIKVDAYSSEDRQQQYEDDLAQLEAMED